MEFLSANGLSKRFGGIVALSEASFSARAGEVHALLGENGAGKSTFIQILAGVLRADEGRIALDGAAYQPGNPDRARQRGVVTVFQELSPIPDLTVEGNIWFRREPRTRLGTLDRREMRRRTEALFQRYAFPALDPGKEVRHLSLAERQLVEIARALSQDPRILILDEATSALAARETEWLLGLTRRLAAEGRLVIFISHRMGEVRAIADRLTIFRGGRTVAAHPVTEVSDEEIVTQMIGRRLDRLFPERTPHATGRIALLARGFSSSPDRTGIDFELGEGEVLGVAGLQGHGQR
ncbi:MAG: sugar ABC transporter ATP-binding protein, partial [Rhizobiales bacterium]|nr:sugar ABC transporter ATP-binding protein [Hyphomicrobiales bacterium]